MIHFVKIPKVFGGVEVGMKGWIVKVVVTCCTVCLIAVRDTRSKFNVYDLKKNVASSYNHRAA